MPSLPHPTDPGLLASIPRTGPGNRVAIWSRSSSGFKGRAGLERFEGTAYGTYGLPQMDIEDVNVISMVCPVQCWTGQDCATALLSLRATSRIHGNRLSGLYDGSVGRLLHEEQTAWNYYVRTLFRDCPAYGESPPTDCIGYRDRLKRTNTLSTFCAPVLPLQRSALPSKGTRFLGRSQPLSEQPRTPATGKKVLGIQPLPGPRLPCNAKLSDNVRPVTRFLPLSDGFR